MTRGAAFRRVTAVCALVVFAIAPAHAESPNYHLQKRVDQTRSDYGLVGLGAVIATSKDGVVEIAVSGQRVLGGDDPIRVTDSWHIGSNTKMLTALLYARLVQAGHAKWGATLPEMFPQLAEDMDAGWTDVTIEDLLSHRSGAAANASMGWMLAAKADKSPLDEQRARLVARTVAAPPSGTRGEFVYSNLGFMMAGAAIERIASDVPALRGNPYETLLRELVILKGPEGSAAGFGFGPPRTGPQGHGPRLFGLGLRAFGRGVDADNPAALGPAGTVHYSLRGHATMLLSFLDGPDALPKAMRAKLMSPYPDGTSEYALGWGMKQVWPAGEAFMHAGSNTLWLSQVVVLPSVDTVIIVNTNQYNQNADKAVRELTEALVAQAGTQRRLNDE
ncbi:serine hydrolase domain-containing protein [Hyphomonas sp.]|uniref:serine hydrolase domain-containing protein n=1 Tax=Hyphomonas sp. TaxID=87 RepID=UPI0025C5D839|nr:serine hydrolase domain-containing protein [Hyphomonas sp.]